MWRQKLFKWLHNSTMEMWTEAAYQCSIFTCVFVPTLGCFYPVGHPTAYHYCRWIHINTSHNYFKFWMYWSWQTGAHTTCCNLEYKVKVYFLLHSVKSLTFSFLLVFFPDTERCLNQLLDAEGECHSNWIPWE